MLWYTLQIIVYTFKLFKGYFLDALEAIKVSDCDTGLVNAGIPLKALE